LSPVWNESFRFEVSNDSLLQSEPIEFRVMDRDLFSTDDAVGLVVIDLSPLLMRIGTQGDGDQNVENRTIRGWFPIYDTLRGIRGELNLDIRLNFINDESRFRETSAGVVFFPMSLVEPTVYTVLQITGFVEELIVGDDPEFELMDRARSSRSSNEMRLSMLYKLGAVVRRQLGRKVLEMGGNAVLNFRQHFDVEGDSGIVARAYGTAALIVKTSEIEQALMAAHQELRVRSDSSSNLTELVNSVEDLSRESEKFDNESGINNLDNSSSSSVAAANDNFGRRRSRRNSRRRKQVDGNANKGMWGDGLVGFPLIAFRISTALSGNKATLGSSALSNVAAQHLVRLYGPSSGYGSQNNSENLNQMSSPDSSMMQNSRKDDNQDINNSIDGNNSSSSNANNAASSSSNTRRAEVELSTLCDFPARVKVHCGGIVMARSVKFLGRVSSTKSDQETRDAWWIELREELRSHARSLCCTHVIG
jgi:hypothetical protein